MKYQTYRRLTLVNLFYLLAVIVFGAYVRASGSGAGCGSHWPLCNGEIVPMSPSIQTVIEFTHRLTSGLTLPFTILLVWLAHKIFANFHPARRFAWMTVFFVCTEALIGAGLVLFEHVAENTSQYRAISMSLHLINTFFLIACASLLWRFSRSTQQKTRAFNNSLPYSYYLGVLALLLTGISGAITALGDTVFPLSSREQAWQLSLDPGVHLFVKLRVYHPIIAVISSAYVIFIAQRLVRKHSGTESIGFILTGLILVQLLLGLLNTYLMAPIWLQMLHLLLAESIWIFFILLGSFCVVAPYKSKRLTQS